MENDRLYDDSYWTRIRPPRAAVMTSTDDPYALKFPVVALVSSLGGLDALSQVLAPLPADLRAALLVLQDLNPDQPSHLADVLDRRTALSVRQAVNGAELVMGTVLVAPSARHLLVTSEARVG
jgi:two-component system, chemotaxis family, protein-glutamate methylesterase/glutaminase